MIVLLPNESVVLVRRKYWLPISIKGLSLAFLALVPVVLLIAAGFLPAAVRTVLYQFPPLIIFAISAWLLILWMIFFIAWTTYYLDMVILTNKRLVDIDQVGLFARNLSELRLENIEDITVEIEGLLPSLLNYGNLRIQTAGATEDFLLDNIYHPHELRNLIAKQCELISEKKIPANSQGHYSDEG